MNTLEFLKFAHQWVKSNPTVDLGEVTLSDYILESAILNKELEAEFQLPISLYHNKVDNISTTDVEVHKYSNDKLPLNIESVEKEEYLCHFWFPTGAYRFHKDYPLETFGEFIKQLYLECPPKYFDEYNHHFYYDSSNAKVAVERMVELFHEYKGKIDDELKRKKIAKLQAEIDKLEG